MSFEAGSSSSLNVPVGPARSFSSLEDEEVASTASGQSSVDLNGLLHQQQSNQSSLDDSERLSMLSSAVSWIKEELAAMRDTDRGILHQLLRAHSAITDIRESQKKNGYSEQSQQDQETDDNITQSESIKEEELNSSGHSDYYSRDEKTPGSGSHVSLDITTNTTPPRTGSSTTNNTDATSNSTGFTPLKKLRPETEAKDDDDILAQFFGEESLSKFTCLSKPRSSKSKGTEQTDSPTVHAPKTSQSTERMQKQHSFTATSPLSDRLKVDVDKKSSRSSVAYEMQLLRQKLQEEAKSELEAFDREFDGPASVPSFLEVEKKSYRYSILNRMDELLYPSSPPPSSSVPRHRSGSHIRQYSEPVVNVNLDEYTRGEERSNFKTSQSTTFSQFRKSSEPAHSSFRLPTSKTMELSRTGSGYYHDNAGGGMRVTPPRKGSQTHYDTTVIKRRSSNSSRSSSQTNTLEKKGHHPLQYSVESLEGGVGSNDDLSSYNGQYYHRRDGSSDYDNIPENKSIRGTRNDSGNGRKGLSPEVYPESMSPSPPLTHVSSSPLGLQGRSFNQKPRSVPLRKKNFISQSPESSWL
ncbi:PREDICTED: uncharacterized protein LOC109582847 [Amphimedon queenslandica]|uniref:Uncharacterized protein n=1 Tax=Amphimedon queenslandica TaxID=400682 RepID=A0A1X7VSY0_AMPQE|nr:PREDICTED: uncharacterized protein LOC109582847 [Amphimedon queenslandica]|eukprot:XP_019853404.1 PREDICTED: uncharacterized protein LOC109582847 [Amphimedon queenslandica]